MTIHWKAVGQCFTALFVFFNLTQFVILKNLSVFDLAPSGVKANKKASLYIIPRTTKSVLTNLTQPWLYYFTRQYTVMKRLKSFQFLGSTKKKNS